MIRILLLFIVLLNAQIFFGQKINANFYYANDPDGWVNVRQDDQTIIDRLPNNTIVYAYPDGNDQKWLSIEYKPKGSDGSLSVLIHKSRLQSLQTLE